MTSSSSPNPMARNLALAAAVGAAAWALSEALEIVWGGYAPMVLWLTAAFHLLIGLGVWGIHLGAPPPRRALAGWGAALASVGYLAMTWPPIAVVTGPGQPMPVFLEENPIFGLAGGLAVVGTVLLGVAIFVGRHYPRWTGAVLIVAPPIMGILLARQGPTLPLNGINLLQSAAWITLAVQVLSQHSERSDG